MKKRNGFTLVELLAVIVILAIILVIAVPAITKTIEEATRGSFESSAKLMASNAETYYLTQQALGNTITSVDCGSIATLNSDDYDLSTGKCTITISGGNASVTLEGKTGGRFAGCKVTGGTKTGARASGGKCGSAS